MRAKIVASVLVLALILLGCTSTEQGAQINGKLTLSDRYYLGSENASVVIVEFSDFQCPFCAKARNVIKRIASERANEVVIYYKHFPLPFHENAFLAAVASECAGERGKFWEYHDKLFENQQALDPSSLIEYAEELGIGEGFEQCLTSEEKKKLVERDLSEGTAIGVKGTPSFVINNKLYTGLLSYEQLNQIIDEELKKG